MRRDRDQTLGWKVGIAFDVLVPVVLGSALLALVILIFAASSTRGAD